MAPSLDTPVIRVHDLVKHYRQRRGGGVVKAVDGIDFTVRRGEIVGLLGPNGAGKTTTIKLVCGLIRPDRGTVVINGVDNRRRRRYALRHISAVLEGNRNLYWRLTVRENLEYFAANRGRSPRGVRDEIGALLDQFRLAAKERELVGSLSRGMQQKLAIAVSLLAGTEVVLLDEPTLGLDVETGYEVRQLLRDVAARGRTVIISTHDMPVVQDLCRRAVIIDAGRVVTDDLVANLLRLFETRAYAVRLGAPLGEAQRRRLEQAFPVLEVAADGRWLRVDLAQGDDIYRLMAILEAERTPVEAIDRTVIDFEQVFRRIVNGANGTKDTSGPPRAAPGRSTEEADHALR